MSLPIRDNKSKRLVRDAPSAAAGRGETSEGAEGEAETEGESGKAAVGRGVAVGRGRTAGAPGVGPPVVEGVHVRVVNGQLGADHLRPHLRFIIILILILIFITAIIITGIITVIPHLENACSGSDRTAVH